MAQGLRIDEVIDISTTVQSGGTIRTEFGTGFLLTERGEIPAGGSGKCRYFRSLSEVTDVFGSTGQIAHDAGVWFGADPAPKGLYIGRWSRQDVNTKLITGSISASQSEVATITNGSYRLNGEDDTGISFSGTGDGENWTNISNHLAEQLSTITGTGTVSATYNPTTKKITIDFGTTNNIGQFSTSESSIGTDLTNTFALTAGSGAEYLQGNPTETVTEAVSSCVSLATGGAPTALMIAGDLPNTYGTNSKNVKTEMRTFAQSGDYMFAMMSTDSSALVPNDSTSDLASTYSSQQSHVIPIYSRSNTEGSENYPPRPDIGIMAKLSSQNFNLPASIISLVPKAIPSVGTTIVNTSQLLELERKRASIYTMVGGLPSFLGGMTAKDGIWADAQWWLLWLKNETERTLFEAMRSSNRLSNTLLIDSISSVMNKAVQSGGAKLGGKVSDTIRDDIRATTGNLNFDGTLQSGYVLWVDPPQNQTDADRAARVSRFKVWIAPSEAIHSITGSIILSG